MTLYDKVMAVVTLLRDSIRLRALKGDLAPAFSESSLYVPGRLVIYNNRLYRCVAQHQGIWSDNDFQTTTIDAALATKEDEGGGGVTGDLYVKDGEGRLHKVAIGQSGGIYVLEVDQDAVEEE